jgi:hypothetical protein
MTPGPDHVLACPHCGALSRRRTIASGNTFGARFWTDGFMDAPMMPRFPAFTRCHACDRFFWFREAEKIGEFDRYRHNPRQGKSEWAKLPAASEPDEFDHYDALEAGLADTTIEEINLRTEAWWASNHMFRDQPDPPSLPETTKAARHANMIRLIVLIETSDALADRIMRAELHRELGEFDVALTEISAAFGPDADAGFREAALKIQALAQHGERQVSQFG